MRRLLIFALAAALSFSLSACGIRDVKSTKEPLREDGKNEAPAIPKTDLSDAGDKKDNGTDGDTGEAVKSGARFGVLQKLPLCDGRAITGLIAVSAKSPAGTLEENIINGYKTEGISCEYHLDEPIELYLATELVTPFFNVCFVKDDGSSDYAGMTANRLEALSLAEGLPIMWGVCPDSESFGYIGTVTISSANASPGAYYAFFITDNKPMYMLGFDIVG